MFITISHDAISIFKDQLLKISPGAAVRQAHHMREIERLTATNHFR